MEMHYLCPMFMVFDMKNSLRFYVDILGFEIRDSAGEIDDIGWVWLQRDGLNLMLNTQYELADRPQHPEAGQAKANGNSILYFGCPHIDDAYHELVSKGVKCSSPKVASYGMKQFYLHDPDGYGICFQWPHNTN